MDNKSSIPLTNKQKAQLSLIEKNITELQNKSDEYILAKRRKGRLKYQKKKKATVIDILLIDFLEYNQ